MSARWLTRAALVASVLGQAGCSLVALSEDIVQGTCQDNADCDVLNDEDDPDFDPCQRWQCNTKEKLCRYGKLDGDSDGQTPATVMHGGKRVTCERNAQKQDCDDRAKLVGSGFEELCDELDNDCDGRADEAVLEHEATRAVVFSGERGEAATDAAYARDPMSGEVAVGYGLLEGANARPGASLLDAALSTSADASRLLVQHLDPPFARQVALAPLDGGRFAYALATTSGTRRLIAGVWSTGANQISVQADHAQTGVLCRTDLACGALFLPALASLESHVLIGFLHYPTEPTERSCNRLEEPEPPAELHYALLLAKTGSRPEDVVLEQQGPSSMGGGRTRDLSRPGLLTVPAIGKLPASWLVSYANAEGSLVVDHAQRRGMFEIEKELPLLMVAGGEPRSATTLALGPADDEGQLVGIAYQVGCGSDARVFLDVHRLRDDGGRMAIDAVASGVAVGGASNESQPALAYSPERDLWLVVYRDLTGLRARALARDGTPHGTAPYTLIERVKPADGDEVDVLPLPLAVFERGDELVTLAHVLRAGQDDPRAFEAVHLGCGF